MRLIPFMLAGLSVLTPAPSFAQEWIEYSNRVDFFAVNFPHEPKVETFTYLSEQEAPLPARRYTAEQGASRYSMTVVDYSPLEAIQAERVKNCPPDAHTGCAGSGPEGITGSGYSKVDKAGAVDFATWHIIQRGSKITYFAWNFADLVDGRWIHLNNPDESRTFIALHMHEDRLYILEATVPKGYPEPGLFQQSIRFLDEQGNPVRYQSFYHNGYPKPARARGGQAR